MSSERGLPARETMFATQIAASEELSAVEFALK